MDPAPRLGFGGMFPGFKVYDIVSKSIMEKNMETKIRFLFRVWPALIWGVPLPNDRALKNKNSVPSIRALSFLGSLWIDVKGRVENLSYIFRAPKSKHIEADLASLPLVLNKRAAKHVKADLNAKSDPTLE